VPKMVYLWLRNRKGNRHSVGYTKTPYIHALIYLHHT